eukprot:c45543_g1_i1 orf=3-356(-)
MRTFIITFFFLLFPSSFPHLLLALQQSYPSKDYTMDCANYHADNAGYLCDPTTPSCETLAYFHVQGSPFSTVNTIATDLFNTTPSSIAEASGLSSHYENLSPNNGLYIPVTCTCNGNF